MMAFASGLVAWLAASSNRFSLLTGPGLVSESPCTVGSEKYETALIR